MAFFRGSRLAIIGQQVTPPSSLTYGTNPASYPRASAITTNSPSSSGGAVASYSISPALPTGLSFNTLTGAITGTPTVTTASAVYTVTATNAGGNTTCDVTVAVTAVSENVVWASLVNTTAAGNQLDKTSGADGWNAGAISTQSIPATGGFMSFKYGNVAGTDLVCGLGIGNTDASNTDVNFGIYVHNFGGTPVTMGVMEGGTERNIGGNAGGGFYFDGLSADSVYRIEVSNTGAVRYYIDDVFKFISAGTATFPVVVDCSIYRAIGGRVTDVIINY